MTHQAQPSTPKQKAASTPGPEPPVTVPKTSREITAEVTAAAKTPPQSSKSPAATAVTPTPPPPAKSPAPQTQGAEKTNLKGTPAAAAAAAATRPHAAAVAPLRSSAPLTNRVISEEMLDAMQGGNGMTDEPFARVRTSIAPTGRAKHQTITIVPPSAEAAAAAGVDSQGIAPVRDVDGIETFKRRRSSVASDQQTLLHMQQAIERVSKKPLKPRIETIDEQHLRSKGEMPLKSVLAIESRSKKKTAVKFCDADGVELATVREYYNQDEAPEVPLYATAYLNLEEQDAGTPQADPDQLVLRPGFSQPGAAPNFMGRVHKDKVALEFCLVNDEEMTVTGTVRVANIAFSKAVNVRFTIDNWKNVDEVKANYVYYSNDGATDRFSFVIPLPVNFGPGGQMQFALKYEAGPETFWDNNSGHNYKVDCYTREMLQTAANMNYMSSLYPSFTWLQYL